MNQQATDEWLPYYLRDHMAGATAGVNFFGRVASGHSHQQVRTEVARMHLEIQQERHALRAILVSLGIRPSSATMVAAVIGERAGRLKPNGKLLKRSVGADVLELEALTGAVQAKARLWETLIALAETNPELDARQLRELQDQANDQRECLIALHAQVVRSLRTK